MGDFSRNFTFLHRDFEHDAARHVTVDDGIDERLVRHARGLRHFQLVRISYILIFPRIAPCREVVKYSLTTSFLRDITVSDREVFL